MSTTARPHQRSAARGGLWAAILVVALLAGAVWGAWRLGVMAGEGASWARPFPTLPEALRKTPVPAPPTLPAQRRPNVDAAARA